jgi:hypothetical protein
MAQHARLAPSSAHRWLCCPGSVEQSSGIPNRTTPAAELGTACHFLSQWRLEGADWEAVAEVEIDDQGNPEPGAKKRIPVTDEMRAWVRTTTDWVLAEVAKSPGAQLECEVRLNPGAFFGTPDELFGTADVLLDAPSLLSVCDFKYGTGHVEVEENEQLLLYAIGAAERTGWNHPMYRLAILQPRTGTGEARTWTITRRELMRYAESFREKVIAATRHGAALVPSDEGCRWCPAAGRCAKLQERNLELAMRQFADPRYITESELLLLLGEAKRIRVGLDAAEDYAQQRLATGLAVPGWKRVAARTNREWADEDKAAKELESYLSLGAYESKLISPAKAEKALGKMAGMVKHLITQREGSPTLAPATDRRPALPADV